jgi:predicted hotdog family 3-hydroxylacyl-ACP dehydratase
MILTAAEIQQYIPQRYPFVMVDNLIEASAKHFITDFKIKQDNIFIEDGFLREFALIENIAQSSAAGIAFASKYDGKTKPEGYLGAITKLKLFELPEVNETVVTVVNLLIQFEHMFLLRGENYCMDRKLMECEIKVVGI